MRHSPAGRPQVPAAAVAASLLLLVGSGTSPAGLRATDHLSATAGTPATRFTVEPPGDPVTGDGTDDATGGASDDAADGTRPGRPAPSGLLRSSGSSAEPTGASATGESASPSATTSAPAGATAGDTAPGAAPGAPTAPDAAPSGPSDGSPTPTPGEDGAVPAPTPSAAAPATTPAPPSAPAGGSPPAVAASTFRTPLEFGARGDGTTDDTAALQQSIDSLRSGDALVLPAGRTFAHSSLLRVRQDGVTITGGGTLRSTRPESSTLWVEADDVTVSGITLTSDATTRGGTWDDTKLLVKGSSGVLVEGVTIRGSRSAGIFVDSSTRFVLRDVVVEDTKADGIHITRGSSSGTVERAVVRRSGDDGIAVVSYRQDAVSHDIAVRSPRVETTTWGRGLSVVGGQRVTFSDVFVDSSDAAAVFVASEAGWNTHATSDVVVERGTLVNANKSATIDHGAVLVLSEGTDRLVERVRISDLTVRDTNARASRETGILGGPTGITMERIHVVGGGGRGVFVSNSPAARFTLTGWTKDGQPVADRSQ